MSLLWHKIANQITDLNFLSNNIAVADLDGKKICVGKFNDSYFAFAYKCPHAGGTMADGHIDALGNVVCPLHRYKYNMQNGRNTSGEGYYLKHWPLELRDDGVYVAVQESGGFFNLFR